MRGDRLLGAIAALLVLNGLLIAWTARALGPGLEERATKAEVAVETGWVAAVAGQARLAPDDAARLEVLAEGFLRRRLAAAGGSLRRGSTARWERNERERVAAEAELLLGASRARDFLRQLDQREDPRTTPAGG